MNLSEAYKIAFEHCESLKEFSSECIIAGSIRRKKEEVKDIEIVALIPRSNRTKMYNILSKSCYWKKGQGIGRYMQWQEKKTGINIDLFLPMENDYYRQVAIRTGSADFTAKIIAGGWVKSGWVGTEDGLRKRDECVKIKGVWTVTTDLPTLPPVWKSEEEFFNWLGVRYLAPEYREYKTN